MNNRITITRILFAILTVVVLCASIMPAFAQDATPEPLICDRFEGESNEVRVGYYMGEGAGYFTAGRYDDAIDSYSCVLEIDGNYIAAFINRALAHTERRDYEEAIKDYTSALGIEASNSDILNNRAIVYAASGDYDKALADLDAAVSADSSNLVAISNRGIIHAVREEYTEALADFQQTLTIDEDYAQAYALIGVVYSQQALESYRRYMELAGDRSDNRIQAAASSLESRLTFDLRLDDGSWLLQANFAD